MTGLITGLMTILLGFLLMFLTPEPARAAAADLDFEARCDGAPQDGSGPGTGTKGVLRCFSFDTPGQLGTVCGAACANLNSWGLDFGVMAGGGPYPDIDTSVKSSGGGSMRQPSNGTSQPQSWFTHFGPGKTAQMNPGDEVYVQYRYRLEPPFLNAALWPGSDGFKQDSFSLGDHPDCGPSTFGISSICTTSCQAPTIVTQNSGNRGSPIMYANCIPPQGFTSPGNFDGKTLWTQPAWAGGCPYPGPFNAEPACVIYQANEWMTFKKYLKMGNFNSWDNVIKVWVGREGQPLKMIFHCGPGATRPCNYGHDGQTGVQVGNGWLLSYPGQLCDGSGGNCRSGHKMGKVYLLSYQTGFTGGGAVANVWYDELVIATKDIADPGGVASSAPSAPIGLRVSGFLTTTSPSALSGLALSVIALTLLMRNGGVPRVKRGARGLMSAVPKSGRRSNPSESGVLPEEVKR